MGNMGNHFTYPKHNQIHFLTGHPNMRGEAKTASKYTVTLFENQLKYFNIFFARGNKNLKLHLFLWIKKLCLNVEEVFLIHESDYNLSKK